jgi:hypothetical protein
MGARCCSLSGPLRAPSALCIISGTDKVWLCHVRALGSPLSYATLIICSLRTALICDGANTCCDTHDFVSWSTVRLYKLTVPNLVTAFCGTARFITVFRDQHLFRILRQMFVVHTLHLRLDLPSVLLLFVLSYQNPLCVSSSPIRAT